MGLLFQYHLHYIGSNQFENKPLDQYSLQLADWKDI